MITIKKYTQNDENTWNAFVATAKNSLFMHDRRFMDYHKERFTDFSLMFYDDDELLALLPANIKENTLFSHAGLTYGGFICNTKMKQHKMNECFEVLKNYLKENNINSFIYKTIPYVYHKNPSQEDLYTLFVNNTKMLKIEAATIIDFNFPIKIPKGRKAQIARAKREGVKIEESVDFESFIDLENAVLMEKHNTKAVHSAKELELLHSHFPEQIKLFAAFFDGKMIAASLIFIYENVIHTQYLAANEKAREIGALDYVISEIINKYSATKRYLDFGISTEEGGRVLNEGLISQKESFGGRTVVYQTWEMCVE